MTKRCTKCGRRKSVLLFAKNSKTADGLFTWCKLCSAEHGKEYRKDPRVKAERAAAYKIWAKAHPDRKRELRQLWGEKNPDKSWQYSIKRRFKITPEKYHKMLKYQRGACAICGGSEKGRRLAIDHCHETGKVRGLLCSSCNKGLGHFEDNPGLMQTAVWYLEKYR